MAQGRDKNSWAHPYPFLRPLRPSCEASSRGKLVDDEEPLVACRTVRLAFDKALLGKYSFSCFSSSFSDSHRPRDHKAVQQVPQLPTSRLPQAGPDAVERAPQPRRKGTADGTVAAVGVLLG